MKWMGHCGGLTPETSPVSKWVMKECAVTEKEKNKNKQFLKVPEGLNFHNLIWFVIYL